MGRVLVVEDDEQIARLMVRALQADVGGRYIDLSLRESMLLRHLMHWAGRACTRAELLADVWAMSFDPGSNVVDVCIRRLRTKLEGSVRLETIRNVGYRLVVD